MKLNGIATSGSTKGNANHVTPFVYPHMNLTRKMQMYNPVENNMKMRVSRWRSFSSWIDIEVILLLRGSMITDSIFVDWLYYITDQLSQLSCLKPFIFPVELIFTNLI